MKSLAAMRSTISFLKSQSGVMMRWSMGVVIFLVTAFLFSPQFANVAHAAAPAYSELDCANMPCAKVLPAATSFELRSIAGLGKIAQGTDAGGKVVGWVALSTDVVEVNGYSGKPLITLVALDPQGVITGVAVLHHSEPILLVGIPEQKLHDFVAKYRGHLATESIAVGASTDENAIVLDVISGATVTVLAENRTIIEAARKMGRSLGVFAKKAASDGKFVAGSEPWSWQQLTEENALAHLQISATQMGAVASDQPFLDLWFGIVDPPAIGRSLSAPGDYDWLTRNLKPGEHLLFLASNGSSSFKGSGFVRGGIFDRIRLEQGLDSWMFEDHDYLNVPNVLAAGAPTFKEAAIFVVRGDAFDPGAPYRLQFIGSRYDQKGGFSREFESFSAEHQLPSTVYLDAQAKESSSPSLAAQAWYGQRWKTGLLSIWLLGVSSLFIARRWLTAKMKRLKRLHIASMLSAIAVGLLLHVQPSVTQVLTFVDTLIRWQDFSLFLLEPSIFVFWIFIFIVSLVWGRGVFCGWTCPYGALSEMLYKLAKLVRIPSYELPERVHRYARHARYPVLLILLGLFLWSPQIGEKAAEIEPFKSTFYVVPWTREFVFLAWWSALLIASLFIWRPFCRYICPLGAGLAVISSVRRSGPYRRNFCDKCKICTRGCEPRAIDSHGHIDPRECLSCMECEANYREPQICPPLISLDRLTAKIKAEPSDDLQRQLEKCHIDLQDRP